MTNKRQQYVDEALASLKIEGLEVDDFLRTQLDEYLAGRMTTKMMLQMVDEHYLEKLYEKRRGGQTKTVKDWNDFMKEDE